jgi:hypothetical protein
VTRKIGALSCVIFSRGWPSWCWAAKSRGFAVKCVVLGDVQWKGVIKKFSPSTEVLVWGMVFCDGTVDMSWLHTDVIFSDFHLKGKLKPLWSYASTHIVLSKPSRNPPLGWYYQKLFLEHSFCGGVCHAS